jgi:nicotinamidase-related amidase
MADRRKKESGRSLVLREAYVDSERLESKAEAWLDTIRPYARHTFSSAGIGRHPALLVIDMQRFFLEEETVAFLPAGKAVLPRVVDLVQAFREKRRPVIFTRHVDRPRDTGGAMYRWWGHLMKAGDPMTGLHPDLVPGPGEFTLPKEQYNAFLGTDLESVLRETGSTCVVVTGVMTHLCCESTARHAFMRGFDVIVAVDGTATLNETLHVSSLRGLAHGFATMGRAKDIMDVLAS